MNKVLSSFSVLVFVFVLTSGSVSAQVIGGSGGATGQINENSSSASSFQQAPNQNQPSGNTAQNSSSAPLFEELTNTQLTVTGAAPSSANEVVSEKGMNIGLIIFLVVITFGVLFLLYKLNKDGFFDTKEYKNMDINVDEPLKTSEEIKKSKPKTKAKKKKNKKHHR
jgi:predicted PurR-regulated permease PerM